MPALRRPARRWAALVVLMLPVLLVAIDNTVLSFAVPAITSAVRPDAAQLLWIIDVYPLVLAGLLVPMGALGDRFGRRRLLLVGSAGFAVVSGLAAFSPDAGWLIAARALLGFFGAMLMPATLSLLRNIFTDAGERRLAIAIWASGFSGGAALGPIIGGVLLEHFWWGSIFLLAVPLLLPLLIAGPLLLPESRDSTPGPVDVVGILLVIAAMLALVWGIKSLAQAGAAVPGALALVAAAVLGTAFVRRQRRRPVPMLDMRLFADPVFSGAVAANLLSVFSLVGFLLFASQHLQLVSGHNPITAALVLLPGFAATVLAGLAVVPLARRIRPVTAVVTGLALNAAGYGTVMLAGILHSDFALMVAFTVLGVGIGLAETVSNDLILSSVPPSKAGAASAVSETAYEVGAVLGTAVLGSILAATFKAGLQVPPGLSAWQADAARQTLGGALELANSLPPGPAQALVASARAAFDSGVLVTAGIGVALALAAALIAGRALRSAQWRRVDVAGEDSAAPANTAVTHGS
ncbi:MFS transporter [Ruicaihuangia caeni]|uniref:MFS transporter n=1 Tax=Ruicaihuangia caeni TaxID=3042517 RepID=UPI00338D68A9